MKLISVTNRKICTENFLCRIQRIVNAGIDAIILREKDLTPAAYKALAEKCLAICRETQTELICNQFENIASTLYLPIQLSFSDFMALSPLHQKKQPIGVSVHSMEEAHIAAENGAAWLIAGHIFETACKPGLPPRGIEFLKNICNHVMIPVYAIGGVTVEKHSMLSYAGAAGGCIMSEYMIVPDVEERILAWLSL